MDTVDPERIKQIAAEGKVDYISGKKVAIIGAGPAGLTAAYDLVRKGHEVTVFEALDKPGGMTRYGIPEYRLPYDKLDRDIDVIRGAGVKIQCNTWIGRDITLAQLGDQYDAVLLALGLQLGRSTRIPGTEHPEVRKAVTMLRQITDREDMGLPRSAVVVGGGNVAMDIARSVARLQKQRFGEVQVTVTALEDMEQFLADPEEVREALEEGVHIHDARGPRQVVLDGDRLVGLLTWKVLSIFDGQGRFAPRYDDSDERLFEADMVIEAIGQMTDTDLLGKELTEQLEWTRGRLQVDGAGRTSVPWLWAAGDMVNGPDVVHAVRDGHLAAESIDQYFGTLEMSAA